ncbi:MAG TPA: prolipoprotein diacylglyceryl transferase [Ktedonobacterales bacterium]
MSLAYFVLNIDPILVSFGPFAIHWYGLAYVVAIAVALTVVMRWSRPMGIHEDQLWPLFIWTAIAGLIGGRLYFVVQQPNLVQNYLLDPINIIAVWNGGMAFFGAVFLGTLTLFVLAPRYGLSRWIAIDGGALFAVVGQIFGRVGNIVNGDILGQRLADAVNMPAGVCAHAPCIASVADPHLPWFALVYINPNNTFVPPGVPFLPAQIFEMLMNVGILLILFPLRLRLPRIRAGYFFVAYFFLYGLSQFIVFFWRGTEPFTPFLGINGLKQAQWTGIFVMLLAIPFFVLVTRVSAPWRYTAAHPVPWPPATAGSAQASSSASGQQASAAAPVAKSALRPLVKGSVAVAGGPAVQTSTAPAVELPPWRPTRPTGGALRNVFGRPESG